MHDEKLERSPDNIIEQSATALSVERVNPSELNTVAKVLAAAYAEDPIHVWAMPKADTRLDDATAFFTFFLRRMRPHRWEVFTITDRSAVVVMAPAGQRDREYHNGPRYLPTLVRRISLVADYFKWIETFRPEVDHQYIEFIGCLPKKRSQGIGSLLLGSLLEAADQKGLPVWTWSSNPRNLTFYRRLGFETKGELRRNDDTPPVTTLWHPPAIDTRV